MIHFHNCEHCGEALVCVCANPQQSVLCVGCAELKRLLVAFFKKEPEEMEAVRPC